MDTSNELCLNRIIPYDDESLVGLCFRLSAANHCESPCWLLPECRSFYGTIFLADVDRVIPHLTILSGLEESILRAMSLDNLKIKEVKDHIVKKRHRFCPMCMSENPYQRSNWLQDWNFACEEHGIYLIDECPNCGNNITLLGLFNGYCKRCGLKIINTPGIPASSGDLEIQKLLNAKRNNQPVDTVVLEKGNPALLLPSHAFMSLVLFLSKILRLYPAPSFALPSDLLGVSPKKITGIKSVKAAVEILSMTFKLLARWPINFWQYLFEVRASGCAGNRSSKAQEGVECDFRYLFMMLRRGLKDCHFSFIWDAIIDFLNKEPGRYVVSSLEKLLQYSNNEKDFISKKEVLSTLGIKLSHLKRLETGCGVESYNRELAHNTRVVYAIDDYDKLKQALHDNKSTLTLQKASERLGIGRKIVTQLIDGGLLKTNTRIGSDPIMIRQEGICELEALFERPCCLEQDEDTDEDTSEWLTLMQAIKYSHHQVTYSDLLTLAKNNQISYKTVEKGNGLNRLLFCPREIDEIKCSKIEAEVEKQGMPLHKARAIMHISKDGLARLIRLGLLGANRIMFNGKQSYRVTRSQIEEFIENYTFIPESSNEFGVPQNTIRNWVKKGLIPSATKFGKEGGEQYVFEKQDLVRILEFRNSEGPRFLRVSPDLGTTRLKKGQVALRSAV